MKTILLLFISLNFFTNAQNAIELSIDNPAPRVGDDVEISFSIDFFTDEIKRQLETDANTIETNGRYGISSDQFSQTLTFHKKGKHTIGPFQFEFNGQKISTDSIVVDVAEKLPLTEGAWIQVVSDHKGNHYLIIEQLIPNTSDQNGYEESYSFSEEMGSDDNLADLAEHNFEGVNVSFQRSSSTSNYGDSRQNRFGSSFSYSFKKYQVYLNDNFSGSFTFRKKHFSNLPKQTQVKNLTITK